MIPLKDQDAIREKFGLEFVGPVKIDYFTERDVPIDVPGKTPCVYCKQTQTMLQELAGLNDLIRLNVHILDEAKEEREKYGIERVPATVVRGMTGGAAKYYGMPAGTEFPAFLETLVDFSRLEVLLTPESAQALVDLPAEVTVKVFVTPTCGYCPGQMRLAYQSAMVSEKVRAEVIEVNEFPELGEAYKVQAVPLTVIGERVLIPGATPEKDYVEQLVKVATEIAAEPPKNATRPCAGANSARAG